MMINGIRRIEAEPEEIRDLIKKVQREFKAERGFEGCWYMRLTDGRGRKGPLYLVLACTEGGDGPSLMCKVAYNADDLQCDYDWDWEEPSDGGWSASGCQSLEPERMAQGIWGYLLRRAERRERRRKRAIGKRSTFLMKNA